MKYALLSVSDKTGIVDLAASLADLGYTILSTGGTATALKKAGIAVTNVSDVTGFPECLDGRVKTLHPVIHAGLLAMRSNPEHMAQLAKLNITPIDVVVVNLYPFRQTIAKPDVTLEDAIENIDIGGPTMLRAAAKNWQDVIVLTDPNDYAPTLDSLRATGAISREEHLRLAYKVYAHTASYDAMVSEYLRKQLGIGFPDTLTLAFEAQQDLRYGENPHQSARFYREMGVIDGTLAAAEQLHGKELSYNNIADTNGALEALREFKEPTVVGVKHANPCGVGTGATLLEAWEKAYSADPVSIFGGIVATNMTMDAATAERIHAIFIEIVVAPDYTQEALDILTQKKNIRLLKLPSLREGLSKEGWDMKRVSGGLLVQERDLKLFEGEWKVVTKRAPTEKERKDMEFALKLVKHIKSNGIAVAKDGQSLGMGPGQVNRIWATEHALAHAGEKAKGAALASDAYFPFDDCVKAAAQAGITCIIQPGGSIRDADSIAACDEAGIAMVFTGMRHFKHS